MSCASQDKFYQSILGAQTAPWINNFNWPVIGKIGKNLIWNQEADSLYVQYVAIARAILKKMFA